MSETCFHDCDTKGCTANWLHAVCRLSIAARDTLADSPYSYLVWMYVWIGCSDTQLYIVHMRNHTDRQQGCVFFNANK